MSLDENNSCWTPCLFGFRRAFSFFRVGRPVVQCQRRMAHSRSRVVNAQKCKNSLGGNAQFSYHFVFNSFLALKNSFRSFAFEIVIYMIMYMNVPCHVQDASKGTCKMEMMQCVCKQFAIGIIETEQYCVLYLYTRGQDHSSNS